MDDKEVVVVVVGRLLVHCQPRIVKEHCKIVGTLGQKIASAL